MSSEKPLPLSLSSKLIILLTIILTLAVLYLAISLISNQNSESENNFTSKISAIAVIDGDTFQTLDGETIRLLCVNTPEEKSEGYEDARAYLSSMILGKDLIIERNGLDKYNRTLAWIYVDSVNDKVLVNKEVVDNGFGSLFEYPENSSNCLRVFSG